MRFLKTEHHSVNSEFTYDIPDEDIVDRFGSLERFKEIASHMGASDYADPIGEAPGEEECDGFYEFLDNYDYDRYDDWVTERKGGYDVTYEVGDA